MVRQSTEEHTLNEEQKQAVEHGEGPLLIIAGAGTGKTTVVTERIKYLIASGKAKPQEILALTFTEKASREMEERVDVALPYGVTQMWISTFHAFCDRILRSEAIHIGLDPGFRLMTEAETIQFFRSHLFSFELAYFRPLGNPNKFIAGMIQHFGRLKDEDVAPNQYMKWVNAKCQTRLPDGQVPNAKSKEEKEENEKNKELARAYLTYEELKVKEGVADYADLIANTLKLFRDRKNIRKQYQEQFKFILIDEFQDTNFAQNELVILLAGGRKNITVVGDDDQAIYRWRGAAVSNIIQFRKRFANTKIVVLTKNYRSTQEILDRSYELIQNNNPDRLEAVEKIDKKLESMRRINGNPMKFLAADRVEEEAEEVAKEIKTLSMSTLSGSGLDKKRPDPLRYPQRYDWKDFAILIRANNHADPFVRALGRAGIPYQFLGPGQLFRQPEVKDLIAYLKVLYRLDDSVAMYRVLSIASLDISARDVAGLVTYARRRGISLFEACEEQTGSSPGLFAISDEGKAKVRILLTLMNKHFVSMKSDTAGEILYDFLQSTGMLEKLARVNSVTDERIAQNIAKFFSKLKTFEVEHEDASVTAVVEWIDLAMQLGESPAATDTDWVRNNAVNILTIHSSKGLEFPVVFLVNLVAARFPTTGRREQIPIPDELVKEILPTGDYHLEEERRLFYVGLTRARDELYLTAAQYYGEGKRVKKLSPFVIETLGDMSSSFIVHRSSSDTKQLTLLDWEKTETPEPPRPLRIVDYLSYSQLDTFATCPLQYKYRYVIRIPVPPVPALTFGDAVHKSLKAFYDLVKKSEKPTKEKLLELFETYWIPFGYGNKRYEEKMHAHGKELLSDFYDKGYDPKNIPTNIEEAFKIKITPALTLGGRIDRIDTRSDGTIEIIDYKTGQTPKQKNPATDLQLTVYTMAAVEGSAGRRKPENVTVSFYYLEGNEKVTATRTQEQLDSAKVHIAQTARRIEASDFRPTPGKQCDFCEFRLICEAWN